MCKLALWSKSVCANTMEALACITICPSAILQPRDAIVSFRSCHCIASLAYGESMVCTGRWLAFQPREQVEMVSFHFRIHLSRNTHAIYHTKAANNLCPVMQIIIIFANSIYNSISLEWFIRKSIVRIISLFIVGDRNVVCTKTDAQFHRGGIFTANLLLLYRSRQLPRLTWCSLE